MVDFATDKRVIRLAEIEKKIAPFVPEIKELKKGLLADYPENVQATLPGLGVVKLSAKKEKRVTGVTYELNVESFLAMTDKQRKDWIDRGRVRQVDQVTGAYYGSVSVELF